MARLLLILTLFSSPALSHANSCCGQSPASFTVLALDQSLSVNAAYSYIESQGRVFNSDKFFIWNNKDRNVQALQLNVAGTIADHQQYFVTSSLLFSRYSDAYSSGDATHTSDTQIGYTYEILPEYSFSYWKPVVYLSLIANVPTGKSIYDKANLSEGADVTGHNQWGAGIGLTARKVFFPLTVTLQARSLRIFSKSFEDVNVSDFYDNSLALLSNYATRFSNISVNVGLTANQLSKRRIDPGAATSETMQNVTVLVGAQKPINESWFAGINYSDQTLIGPARNTILNRTLTINLNYNYF